MPRQSKAQQEAAQAAVAARQARTLAALDLVADLVARARRSTSEVLHVSRTDRLGYLVLDLLDGTTVTLEVTVHTRDRHDEEALRADLAELGQLADLNPTQAAYLATDAP